MHDLMHDLAVSVALDECLAVEVGESIKHVPKTIRHLIVNNGSPQSTTPANPLLTPHSSLRTLLFFDSKYFDSFKFSNTLRALDLSCMQITKLHPSIFHLKLLRYLDLSYNDISLLPKSICKLRNLLMLDLNYNRNLRTLPSSIVKVETLRYLDLSFTSIASLPESFHSLKSLRCLNVSETLITSLPESIFMLTNLRSLDLENLEINLLPAIGKLVNLRHLNLRDCSFLESIPETVYDLTNLQSLILRGITCYNSTEIPIGIGKLTSLRTLGGVPFIVGKLDIGGLGINELQRLNQLRGELQIHRLENVRNAEEARTANLGSKQYLTELELRWFHSDDDDGARSKEVLEGLLLHPHPPPNLQSLKINNYGAEEFSPQAFQGLGGSVPNRNRTLRSLKIWNCENLKSLPAEIGHLTALTSLNILSCQNLASLPQELQKLSSLTSFTIAHCNNFECLPVIGGMNNSISSLLDLKIQTCRNLTSVSEALRYLTSLQRLEISYCPKLELVTQKEDEDGFQHLISLETLVLNCLPQFRALPDGIQRLSMLKTLDISRCKNLSVLPEWLKCLTTLQALYIYFPHPDLNARCEKDKGEDWHKISHIPDVLID